MKLSIRELDSLQISALGGAEGNDDTSNLGDSKTTGGNNKKEKEKEKEKVKEKKGKKNLNKEFFQNMMKTGQIDEAGFCASSQERKQTTQKTPQTAQSNVHENSPNLKIDLKTKLGHEIKLDRKFKLRAVLVTATGTKHMRIVIR